jgi:hypothetical protein
VNLLATFRSLVFGETWTLPAAVAVVAGIAAALHHLTPDLWHDAGGLILAAGACAALAFATARSAG